MSDDEPERPADEAEAVAGSDGDREPVGVDESDASAETATDGGESDDAPPEVADPDAYGEDAFATAIDDLREATAIDDPVDSVRAEKDAIDSFADDMAVAIINGLPKQHASAYASRLKDDADVYNKGDIVDHVNDRTKQLRAQHPSVGATPGGQTAQFDPLDVWLDQNLERVVVLATTDAKQDTTYRWHFANGTVETEASAEGVTHFAWNYFRDEIYQALGVNTAKPTRMEAEEWRQWIATLIENRGEKKTVFGARSHAVEQLQRHVRDNVGYTELSDATERSGVHVEATKSKSGKQSTSADGGRDVDEVRVFYADIGRICDECGIEVRALQSELDARGYVHERVSGVSETAAVGGNQVRYWVFTDEIGVPETILDDPDSPAAQAATDSDPAATPASTSRNTDSGHIGGVGPTDDGDDGDDDGDGGDDDGETDDRQDTDETEDDENESE